MSKKEELAEIGILLLDEDAGLSLRAEKVLNKWNLELIERESGLTWILYCDTKKHAQTAFKGMSLCEVYLWMTQRLKIQPIKMYKAGAI